MKKNQILQLIMCLLIFTSACRSPYGGIDGAYSCNSIGYCRIYSDTMEIFTPDLLICGPGYPIKEKYICSARCLLQHIDGEFYSISSLISPVSELYKSIDITYTKRTKYNDSIDVEFILPNFELPIKFIAHSDTDYESLSQKGRCHLRLPSDCREFTLDIVPINYLITFAPPVFYGLVSFRYGIPISCDATVEITISLPGLTPEILNNYYFNNEFIRITPTRLEMLGELWEYKDVN